LQQFALRIDISPDFSDLDKLFISKLEVTHVP